MKHMYLRYVQSDVEDFFGKRHKTNIDDCDVNQSSQNTYFHRYCKTASNDTTTTTTEILQAFFVIRTTATTVAQQPIPSLSH